MDETHEDTQSTKSELGHLIDAEPGPAASVDNMRAMLGRHSRRRRRLTSTMAAVALAVGVGGGVAIGEGVATVTTGSPLASPNHSTTTGPAPGYPGYASATGKNGGGSGSAPIGLSWATGAAPAAGGSAYPAFASNGTSQGGTYGPSTAFDSPISCQDSACKQALIARSGSTMQRLFDRAVNAVTIRAFALTFDLEPLYEPVTVVPSSPANSGGASGSSGGSSGSGQAISDSTSGSTVRGSTRTAVVNGTVLPILPIGCLPSSELELEVSDAGAVGVMTVPDVRSATRPFSVVEDQIFGAAENAPMEVLAIRTGTGVSSVGARFSNGSVDSMAVVDGWAVLATTLPESALRSNPIGTATVTAYGSGGKVLETANVPETSVYAIPTLCVLHKYPQPQRGPTHMPTGAPTPATKPASGSGGATEPTAGSLPRQ